MRARRCGVKPVCKILRFVGYQSVAEFHDADRIRRHAVIAEHELSDPELAAADNSPDRKALGVGLDGSALLDVVPSADPLARLRVIKHGVIVVDFVLGRKIDRVRSLPMAL